MGGLIGINSSALIAESYWDVELSGIGSDESSAGSAGGTGKSNIKMKSKSTFSNWDWLNSSTETWVMRQNDADNIDFPQLVSHYDCHGSNWTSSPNYTGTGVENDPYIICTIEQLNQLATIDNNSDKYITFSEELNFNNYSISLGNLPSKPFGGLDDFLVNDYESGSSGQVADNSYLNYCHELSERQEDWRAPTEAEVAVLSNAGIEHIRNIPLDGSLWISTRGAANAGSVYGINPGVFADASKSSLYSVICVRK